MATTEALLTKQALITARWRSWLMIAAIFAVAFLAFGWLQGTLLARIARMGTGGWLIVLLAVLVALGWQARGGLRALAAFYDLRHFWVRPPYWLAGLAGGTVALFVASNIDTISAVYNLSLDEQIEAQTCGYILLAGLIGPALCLALVRVPQWIKGRYKKGPADPGSDNGAAHGRPSESNDYQYADLKDWLADDQAIGTKARDYFGHQEIAHRIVDRLISARSDNDADMSQAIVGRFGAGKTSILRLVRRELERRDRDDIEVIEVQMWPYETARAAVVGIIDRLVEALGEHVNVISLRGVSGAYAEAISAAPGGAVLRAALRSRAEQPTQALAMMDGIARVIGVRYVVWIEDLERFATGETGDEKLGPVRALLHGLHRLPSFTVITATAELSHGLDLDKIARYVERVPALQPLVVRQLCTRFLHEWREEAARKGVIVVDSPIDWPSTESEYRYGKTLLGNSPCDIPTAIDHLLTTPRALKQSLRRCNEAWTKMCGEINLDEMLAMSIVRESLPRTYSVIESHIDRLRVSAWKGAEERQASILALTTELETGLAGEPRLVREAVSKLVNEVFANTWKKHLQGFGVILTHVDYWQRFSAVPSLRVGARDQEVLVALLAQNHDQALDTLEDDKYGGPASIHLAPLVPWERLVSLVIPLVRRRLEDVDQRRGGENRRRIRPRGLVSLWNALRVHQRMRSSVDELVPVIGDAIDLCTKNYGMKLLPELEDLFFRARDLEAVDIDPLLGTLQLSSLRERAQNGLARHTTDASRVVAALTCADRWTLLWCIWGVGARRGTYADPQQSPFPAWPEMAAVVLDALDIAPDTMAPQVAMMVFTQMDVSGEQWRFDPALCVARFGSIERVTSAIARGASGASSDKFMLAVRSALEHWRSTESDSAGVESGGLGIVSPSAENARERVPDVNDPTREMTAAGVEQRDGEAPQ